MDSRYPRGNKLVKKENNSRNNKPTNSAPTDTSNGKQSSSTQQISSLHLKKDQNHRESPWHGRGEGQDSFATGVNITKKKEMTPPKLIAFTTGKSVIMPTGVLKRRNRSEKTSIGLDNLHVNDWC